MYNLPSSVLEVDKQRMEEQKAAYDLVDPEVGHTAKAWVGEGSRFAKFYLHIILTMLPSSASTICRTSGSSKCLRERQVLLEV
ncbi:hypothetical protein Tdes44962_MAKER08061 [Teratosphaeria destructans]|uniref:Uncharacterized protein n=1 Tax=Teratosphaeria destructans TaxID=418781 RepID=A0A9W7SXX5_9PEZI|nr:hypothetical protein Tdes44962_MAKER08061 [Teratosphaeria destructans]